MIEFKIEYIFYLILLISFLNLIFILTLSNFLVKLADSVKSLSKSLEDLYYIKNNSPEIKKEESGLVDV